MLSHTLNLTSSDEEFAKFPGRELLVPRLKGGRKGREWEAEQRTKGRREGREGAGEWQGGREEDGGEVEERKRSGKWDEVLMQCCWGLEAPT